MRLKWCGQSCFLLIANSGTRIITDPFNKHLGYPVPRYEVEAITVSHPHYDHNYVRAIPNHQEIPILRTVGAWQVGEVGIESLAVFHDRVAGLERGINHIFLFTIDNLRIAHLGDLGHPLSDRECTQLGRIDVLLTPVGGTYTIGAEEANLIVDKLQPKLTIPMHYQTKTLRYELDALDSFLQDKQNLLFWDGDTVELEKNRLPEREKIAIFQCY